MDKTKWYLANHRAQSLAKMCAKEGKKFYNRKTIAIAKFLKELRA